MQIHIERLDIVRDRALEPATSLSLSLSLSLARYLAEEGIAEHLAIGRGRGRLLGTRPIAGRRRMSRIARCRGSYVAIEHRRRRHQSSVLVCVRGADRED